MRAVSADRVPPVGGSERFAELVGRSAVLAEELGFLRAGPRRVVGLHSAAFRGRIGPATPQPAQAWVEEAPVATLELMDHLAACYPT